MSKRITIYSCMLFFLINTSCKDNEDVAPQLIQLSTTKAQVNFGEEFSVNVSLKNKEAADRLKVIKTIDGKTVASYEKIITVSTETFPYKFQEKVGLEDENGVVVYSFYALDKMGNELDAADVVLYINFGELYSLLKYDWKPVMMMIDIYDFADNALMDNVHRFNEDQGLAFDWGTNLTSFQGEVLESHCAWKVIPKGDKIDSLYMIKYNIMNKSQIILKYKVVEIKDKKMVLVNEEDWSWLGLRVDEPVTTTFEGIAKSSSFTMYRGRNAAEYVIPACNPGSY